MGTLIIKLSETINDAKAFYKDCQSTSCTFSNYDNKRRCNAIQRRLKCSKELRTEEFLEVIKDLPDKKALKNFIVSLQNEEI